MEISSKYNPAEIEDHYYQLWMSNGLFSSKPDGREPYTIVIPPPNVTGILHMGHMLNNTIQDVLVRRARMLGKNACWVPGMDHASIATEAKVVNMLREKGIKKSDLSRDEFMEYAWEWKEKYGGIILNQLKKLGCSLDWDRTRFTMEPKLNESVLSTFVDLYKSGYIYRGLRMVNWDPAGKTALSDEEVIHKEEQSNLYYVKYAVKDSEEFITIATTRPETILGDTGVCVNPSDERYTHLHGKTVIIPIVDREVPIVTDNYVEIEFGTGALKVTPAHDENDFMIGNKYGLEAIDVFNEDGTMSDLAGHYIGQDRFAVRKLIAKQLDEIGILVKTEQITNKVGYSERTNVPVEPRLSLQWFVDMQKFVKDYPEVIDNVMSDEITFHPSKFKNTYNHWMSNIKDWCISRQLWWGQQIPAWYTTDGKEFIALNKEEALAQAKAELGEQITANDLKQDTDVFDTWFSSWLWPVSVFDGVIDPENEEISYYYPTSDLVTAPDIIFFWVARMIMFGYRFKGERPFRNVYFTGIVRDKQRRKMSKQLGNSPDPMDLMAKYGTDGVRLGLLLSAPAGNDLLFDESLCEQGRNFSNKIWNAFRLINGLEVTNERYGYYGSTGDRIHLWMETRINESLEVINDYFDKFRISDAVMTVYKLVWDDFCSWYLEMIKPNYGDKIPQYDLDKVKENFDVLLRMLHPFTPFVSEHLWQSINDREGAFINQQDWPVVKKIESVDASAAIELISQLRSVRNQGGISPKVAVKVNIKTQNDAYKAFEDVIRKLANVSDIEYNGELDGRTILVNAEEVVVEFEGITAEDQSADKEKLEAELKRLKGFLVGINKKLSNERFISNASDDVVDRERKKLQDTESKIQSIEKELSSAGN